MSSLWLGFVDAAHYLSRVQFPCGKKREKRKVYAIRRHSRSFCLQKQPDCCPGAATSTWTLSCLHGVSLLSLVSITCFGSWTPLYDLLRAPASHLVKMQKGAIPSAGVSAMRFVKERTAPSLMLAKLAPWSWAMEPPDCHGGVITQALKLHWFECNKAIKTHEGTNQVYCQ